MSAANIIQWKITANDFLSLFLSLFNQWPNSIKDVLKLVAHENIKTGAYFSILVARNWQLLKLIISKNSAMWNVRWEIETIQFVYHCPKYLSSL